MLNITVIQPPYFAGEAPDAVIAELLLNEAKKAQDGALIVLLSMQKTGTEMLCYYDARIGPSVYGGMFNPDTHTPYRTYYGFKAFNTAYRLGDEVGTACEREGVYLCAARNEKRGVLLIANTTPEPIELKLDVTGADINRGEVIITDEEYLYTLIGPVIKNGRLCVKEHACVEIRLELNEV